MTLTPEQITIVEQYPLKNALDQSRANLREFLPSDDSCRSGVAELLDAISLCLASELLLAPNGKIDLGLELHSIRKRFLQEAIPQLSEKPQFLGGDALGIFSYTRIALWGRASTRYWDGSLLWKGFWSWRRIECTDKVQHSLPNVDVGEVCDDRFDKRLNTPPKSNSSVAEDTESVAAKKLRLFGELRNSLFRSVEGFWEKFFGAGRWETDSPNRHQMCKNLLKEYRNGNWEGLPMKAN
ncbi:hypothetical protein E4U34_005580 [Claviceps purpurea]|nr:hypothetical protein E4U34_005580 [Claviceps purpurea]